ncbi:MAG: M50 family metallopeptidase, partial [Vicinamibacterales bacterium]
MGFLNALYIVPILAILIFLHELGHFVMARRAGVRVEEFGFGLPPRIWGVQRGDTLYSINALPIGGFVRVHGEDGKSFTEDSMQSKTPGQRASFLAAGSIMNFITAFVIVVVLVAFQGQTSSNVYVLEVVPNSPADAAGWQAGDRIIAAAGVEIDSSEDLRPVTDEYAGRELPVTIFRAGEEIETTVVPRENPPPDEGRTGIALNNYRLAGIEVT